MLGIDINADTHKSRKSPVMSDYHGFYAFNSAAISNMLPAPRVESAHHSVLA
jgi:hypothetical protein